MVQGVLFAVDRHARLGRGTPALHPVAAHHRGIVRIGHHRVLGILLVGVANHAEHAQRLGLPVNGEAGVEDFVPTVLAVGLGKHHQFHIAGVAPKLAKRIQQVIDLVVGQRQTPLHIGLAQRVSACMQHIHMLHGRCLYRRKQGVGSRQTQVQ